MKRSHEFDVIVVGGGHAGAEAAWAAANLGARVALVTMDARKIGSMSCNPAIGGLAKGQMVREVDALGGLMGLAADATGIQFRVLNATKGPAVRGPRCQSDKHRYAREVRKLLASRRNIRIIAGSVEDVLTENGTSVGVLVNPVDGAGDAPGRDPARQGAATSAAAPGRTPSRLRAAAVVLTTGTFMRGLMHTGERQTHGGRVGESAAVGISASLRRLGFDLGRLKTGTPPRLDAESIEVGQLEEQHGDRRPAAFSDMTDLHRFPSLEQRPCWLTYTDRESHALIRENLHRAPMYNGQIAPGNVGPRYCPSIEDKVMRFGDRDAHHVFLEPESLDTNEVYCNGISTSLPADVQDQIVRRLPGCGSARILRYGYAVEYDMVWPHQIDATCMTKTVNGLFLAGQINGTSGYEEAAAQGVLAGLNAALHARGQCPQRLRRDQAYIGVLMDDLVTKTPREPYRMFTSRAEHRLLLRADNADERLTPWGRKLGLVDDVRWEAFERRRAAATALKSGLADWSHEGVRLTDWLRRPRVDEQWVLDRLEGRSVCAAALDRRVIAGVLAQAKYAGYIDRQRQQIEKLKSQESTELPVDIDYEQTQGLRREAQQVLTHFRPATLGQAARLAGVNPADLMVISVAMRR